MTRTSLALALVVTLTQAAVAADRMTVLQTPNGGIQPQAVADAKGTLHLIYFKGETGAGDLFYVRREVGKDRFSTPIRVNSRPGSAIATGTVRGGQIALGKGGSVHVAWNGSGKAKASEGMFHARLNDVGTAFEGQRNLMRDTSVLDGGGTVAADVAGNVYVAWHAVKTGDRGEENRQVWVARSTDEGKTFAKETPAWAEPTGACGCCSTRAYADGKGSVYVLYRSANAGDNRDIYLLSAKEKGADFRGTLIHKWKIAACPMSTLALAEGPGGVAAAWDTDGQIYFTTVKPGTTEFTKPQAAPGGGGKRKHPALALNAKGEMVLAWTEGTGWQKGGSLAWQVFDAPGRPTEEKGRVERGIPVWGVPTVVATGEGFTVIY